MRYFDISNGLRGRYMPDNAFILAVKTRRDLMRAIASECSDMREAFGFGGTKREIARTVALVWREYKKPGRAFYPYAIGFGRSRDSSDRPFGVFIGYSSRTEYLEWMKQNENN